MSVMGETITLNKREQKRVLVLNQVIAGQIAAEGAAELLGLSERQVWRKCAESCRSMAGTGGSTRGRMAT